MFKAGYAIAAAFLLTSCAGSFDKPALNADYGPPPSDPAAGAAQVMELALKDPESARYKVEQCFKAYGNNGLIYGGNVTFTGWVCEIWVNSKNSFGGYTGAQLYSVLYRGEKALSYYEGSCAANILCHRLQ